MGTTREDLVGTDGSKIFTADVQLRVMKLEKEIFEEGTPHEEHQWYWSPAHGQMRMFQTSKTPLYDDAGKPLHLLTTARDVTERWRVEQQLACERKVLEKLAGNAPLNDILQIFTADYEEIFEGAMSSILLLDAQSKRLRHSTAPSLPTAYCEAIDGVAIGPDVGSCGTAAFTGKDTIVSDIANDPLWKNYRDLALQHGLRACWSIPIRSSKGRILGTFANYYSSPRVPSDSELQVLKRSANLIALAIEHDETERRLLADQQALIEGAQYRQAILDNMVDAVMTINRSGLVESFNKAACSIFGYQATEIMGQHLSLLMPVAHRDSDEAYLARFLRTGDVEPALPSQEVVGLRKNGSTFPVSVSVSKIMRSGQSTFVAILRDITQQRKDEEEIRRLAFYDPLTSLPNRRLLMDRVLQAMHTSARTGQHGALMFLDLDHFKLLNDTLGHDIGDILLQQVATRLKACVREGDSVARLGGDEFVVLLEALSPHANEAANQAEVVAHKILDALGLPYTLREHTYNSTPSIGIVVFLEAHESMDDLIKKADVAMYQAKSAGRNTVRFFDPVMQAAVVTHAQLEKDIRRGLENNEFALHYQVQVNARGECIGAEALVRWNHHVRGMVSPAHFIPLAEETGIILKLGQWVLETACEQLVQWGRNPTTAAWTLAVNVSASQFSQDDFVDSVARALAKTGAKPHLLKLELTESMLVNDVEDIIIKMNAIKEHGVSFSLDDFGTGYSSLSYLKRLPLAQLKIDQSFVRDLLSDSSDKVIAKTVVALGHSLGLTVIAEGVETAEQRDILIGMGCDAFQGYYYGRPVVAAAIQATHH